MNVKRKRITIQIMRYEFDKVIKEINDLKNEWNYLGRFGVTSFRNKENWVVSWKTS